MSTPDEQLLVDEYNALAKQLTTVKKSLYQLKHSQPGYHRVQFDDNHAWDVNFLHYSGHPGVIEQQLTTPLIVKVE